MILAAVSADSAAADVASAAAEVAAAAALVAAAAALVAAAAGAAELAAADVSADVLPHADSMEAVIAATSTIGSTRFFILILLIFKASYCF
jgi:hypothetical protein